MSIATTAKQALINAGILAGLAFFTTLVAIRISDVLTNPISVLAAAGIAAGLNFFARLAFDYGVGPPKAGPTS